MSLRAESGSMLVEVMVAALVLVVGLLGTLIATNSGKQLTSHAAGHQEAYAVAQHELELIAAQPWPHMALDAYPEPAVDPVLGTTAPRDPAAWLTGCTASICTELDVREEPLDPQSERPEGVAGPETLVVDPASPADLAPRTTREDDGMVVHRFITDATDQCITVPSGVSCPRRVTVAVTPPPSVQDANPKPVWASTIVTNPEVQPL